MQNESRLIISKRVSLFVEELEARYSKYVDDEFLEQLLIERIIHEQQLRPTHKLVDIAYYVGCEIFERVLEYGCKAGGNGHHVAQHLSKIFV